MKKNPILVTGGAGFLGSNLIDTLIAKGQKVLCLDNLYTGSKANVQHLENHPLFEWVEHDICSPIDLEVSEIYNLACPASPVHYQADPIQTWKTSVLGMLNMLELARKNQARIFQASTSEVYGDPLIHPQTEKYWGNVNPIGLRSCYDEGKRSAETLCYDYMRKYDLSIKLIRIFNTYGPRMHISDGRVVSNFIIQALKGEPITVYGDGAQTRSFCYVDDLIDGIIKMMHSPKSFTGPVNLGKPEEFTILELAHLVLELTGSKSKIIFEDLPHDDPKKRKPDITLAKDQLNWSANTPLRKGLYQTILYFEALLSSETTC